MWRRPVVGVVLVMYGDVGAASANGLPSMANGGHASEDSILTVSCTSTGRKKAHCSISQLTITVPLAADVAKELANIGTFATSNEGEAFAKKSCVEIGTSRSEEGPGPDKEFDDKVKAECSSKDRESSGQP